MSVGRNDPCPCGSGKKYKKCCLKKANEDELAAARRETFYEEKQHLVEKIGHFLKSQVPLKEYSRLKTEFSNRTEERIDEKLEESFFTYWLYFYYRFDNDLRGVEWFYKEKASVLSESEQTMTESWLAMRPRFVQAVDVKENVITFEDKKTGEQFAMSRDEENIGHFIPWMSTLAMFESFDGLYYFNGFRLTVEPLQLQYAIETLEKLSKDKQMKQEEAIFTYFPEIVATLLNNDLTNADYGREVAEYTATFEIHHKTIALEFLRSQEDFRIDKWLDDGRELVWAGDWRVYHDSEYPAAPLQLADVFGSIIVSENDTSLTFQTMYEDKVKVLEERFDQIKHAITKVDEISSVIGTFRTHVHNVLVSMEDDMPAYFAIYAQNDVYQDIDQPLPIYDGLTIRDLFRQGKTDIVDLWLRNAEFTLYKQVLERFHDVAVNADFNRIRKDFGLALSPFVTGGAARETSLESIELEETAPRLLEDDIPYLEALGFTPHSIEDFYISDFVRFFKEKVIGESDSIEQKYRRSLSDLRAIMMDMAASSWEQCDVEYWKTVMTTAYTELNPEYSKTERDDFIRVVKTLLTWLDHVHGTTYFPETINYIETL